MTDPQLESIQVCAYSVMGSSIATNFDVLQHVLMHSHGCFKVYILQHFPSKGTPRTSP